MSVLRLANRLRWGVGVQPACLAHPEWTLPEGFMCVVSGWGMTDGHGSQAGSSKLRQAALNHMNDQDCNILYQEANLDTTDDMQCFGTRFECEI